MEGLSQSAEQKINWTSESAVYTPAVGQRVLVFAEVLAGDSKVLQVISNAVYADTPETVQLLSR